MVFVLFVDILAFLVFLARFPEHRFSSTFAVWKSRSAVVRRWAENTTAETREHAKTDAEKKSKPQMHTDEHR